MKRRKGWHIKKRRRWHDHKAQALATFRNQCRRHYTEWAEQLFAEEQKVSPLVEACERMSKP